MFGTFKGGLLDLLDLAVEFATLGGYRLDGPADDTRCVESDERPLAVAFDWPSPCAGSSRRPLPGASLARA